MELFREEPIVKQFQLGRKLYIFTRKQIWEMNFDTDLNQAWPWHPEIVTAITTECNNNEWIWKGGFRHTVCFSMAWITGIDYTNLAEQDGIEQHKIKIWHLTGKHFQTNLSDKGVVDGHHCISSRNKSVPFWCVKGLVHVRMLDCFPQELLFMMSVINFEVYR